MLRIDSAYVDDVLTIRMQGKLLAPWLDELRLVLDTNYGKGAIRLDLSQLTFIDRAGADLLQGARRNGVELVGASDLVADLLELRPR